MSLAAGAPRTTMVKPGCRNRKETNTAATMATNSERPPAPSNHTQMGIPFEVDAVCGGLCCGGRGCRNGAVPPWGADNGPVTADSGSVLTPFGSSIPDFTQRHVCRIQADMN